MEKRSPTGLMRRVFLIFLDDKKSILENPFIELIRAALDAVKECSYESIFRYLKTGFVYDEQYSPDEAQVMTDRMENYARALGIRGWKKLGYDLGEAMQRRREAEFRRTEPVSYMGVRAFKNTAPGI